jgi:polyisoprenoid-binding protein YceI
MQNHALLRRQFRHMLAAAAGSLLLATASLASEQIDAAKSSVTATLKQMNVPVEGKFKKFDAQIHFDSAQPASATAQISVDVATYDLGDESFNSEARGKSWFDATTYPKATFQSTSVKPAGDNKYSVAGKLTIKGKTLDVVVPVSVTQQGGQQVFEGALPIKRTQFDVGTGEWKDTSVVADEVTIKFHVVSAKH